MKFDDILMEMISWGWVLKRSHYEGFKDYFSKMLEKKRVIFFWDGDKLEAVLCYFLTNDYETLYKKSLWHVPDDEPDGKQFYADKLICRKFTLALRRTIQEVVEDNFPNCEEGFYHRAPYDRCVKIKRRKVIV